MDDDDDDDDDNNNNNNITFYITFYGLQRSQKDFTSWGANAFDFHIFYLLYVYFLQSVFPLWTETLAS